MGLLMLPRFNETFVQSIDLVQTGSQTLGHIHTHSKRFFTVYKVNVYGFL